MFDIKMKNAIVEVLSQIGDEMIIHMKQRLRDGNKDSSGKLRDSLDFVITDNNSEITLSIVAEDYFKWVESGRKPGRFPPINKIRTWIRQKRIKSLRGDVSEKSLAFLIGRSIARKGIKPYKLLQLKEMDWGKKMEDAIAKIIIDDITEIFDDKSI